MVTKKTFYVDRRGIPHAEVLDAHASDLTAWLSQTNTVNEASATALSKMIVGSHDTMQELFEMLKAIRADSPAPTTPGEAP